VAVHLEDRFRGLLMHFEWPSQLHYALKTITIAINIQDHCRSRSTQEHCA
jgi:tRNA A37 threonylcarbamoyladenosine biosynthesis protein TsaE